MWYIQAELTSVVTQLEELDRKSSTSERTVKDLKEQLEEAQVLYLLNQITLYSTY